MAKKEKTSHIHKYQRTKLSKRSRVIVYRCMLPGCSHYVHPELLVNKLSICWGCGQPFAITPKSATRKRPKCNACIKKGPHHGNSRPGFEPNRNEDGTYAKLRRELEATLVDRE